MPLAVLVFLTASKVTETLPDGRKHTVLSYGLSGLFRALAFLVGAILSGLAGFIGMSTAVRGNVRTAAAARDGSMAAGAQGGLPHRRRHRHVRGRASACSAPPSS